MFTGIIQSIGQVTQVTAQKEDRQITVRDAGAASRLDIGDSVALDGVCQTVIHLDGDQFRVHAIAETLRVTTLGDLEVGSALNLETALAAGAPLGGHFVQGHVDGVARLESRQAWGDSIRYRFMAPGELVAQLVPKGSVAIHGVSLTVGPDIEDERFDVFLIPHTLEATNLGALRAGARVNLETDILGKYILRYLGSDSRGGALNWDNLARAGFTRSAGEEG